LCAKIYTIEIKIRDQNGRDIPLIARVGVFDVFTDGTLKSIIGRFQVDYGLRFGKVMRFSAYGPEKDAFENDLSQNLFYPFRISDKELEVLRYLSQGFAYKEIADKTGVSISGLEKRVKPLFERFNVKNNASLVAFGFENNLLP
jgi:DNA-binding CsgD family transcriptional regulator